MRSPSKFKKTDLTRAAKAILAAGLEIARLEVATDGSIIVIPGKSPAGTTDKVTDASNSEDFDNWMKAHARPTEGH